MCITHTHGGVCKFCKGILKNIIFKNHQDLKTSKYVFLATSFDLESIAYRLIQFISHLVDISD